MWKVPIENQTYICKLNLWSAMHYWRCSAYPFTHARSHSSSLANANKRIRVKPGISLVKGWLRNKAHTRQNNRLFNEKRSTVTLKPSHARVNLLPFIWIPSQQRAVLGSLPSHCAPAVIGCTCSTHKSWKRAVKTSTSHERRIRTVSYAYCRGAV